MTAPAEVVDRNATAEWRKCPACGAYVYHKRLKRQLGVCPECNHHFRLRLRDRLDQLLDPGSFEELGTELEPLDAHGFHDSKPYPERIAKAQKAAGARSGAVYGRATIAEYPIVLAGIDFGFVGGSMGSAEGEAITLAAELALAERTPLLVISASGGARMQEGVLSLMQLPRTTVAVQMLREASKPYIVVLTNPTTGGVTASYAMLGDVHIAEPGALIGFAGPRVIEQTIREKLPEGFQRAEYLKEHGMVDMVVHRHELRATLANLCRLLTKAPVQGAAPKAEVPAVAVAELAAPASV
jgi:acetyl-CoA carboxylase carboxyl transferase subunit beta